MDQKNKAKFVKTGWFSYLRGGLSRKLPEDRIGGQDGYVSINSGVSWGAVEKGE